MSLEISPNSTEIWKPYKSVVERKILNNYKLFFCLFAAKSVMVDIQSSDTRAIIKVDGRDLSKDEDGFNIVILDYTTGKVEASENFNTQTDGAAAKAMANFLTTLKPATIILVATKGNANVDMTDEAYDVLVCILILYLEYIERKEKRYLGDSR